MPACRTCGAWHPSYPVERGALAASFSADIGILVHLNHVPVRTSSNGLQFEALVGGGLFSGGDPNVKATRLRVGLPTDLHQLTTVSLKAMPMFFG